MSDIQFKCTQILEYDNAAGQYVHCGQPLTAPKSDAGMKLQCSKCQQWVEIPFASTLRAKNNLTADALENERTSQRPKAKDFAIEAEPITDTMSQYDQDFAQNCAQRLGQQHTVLQFDSFNLAARCPLCGHLVNKTNQCTNCEFGHQRESLTKPIPLKYMKVKPTGISLSICRWLSNDTSIRQLVNMSYIAFGVLYCAAGLAAIMIGGPAGMIAMMFAIPLVAVYIYVTSFWVKQNTVTAVPLAFWQKPFWNLLLVYLRRNHWQGRRAEEIIDCRNQSIDDQQVQILPNLSKALVLDLQGTEITDAGLHSLQGLKNLRYIVVRDTQVSDEGVFRLQQELPRAWIWN